MRTETPERTRSGAGGGRRPGTRVRERLLPRTAAHSRAVRAMNG